MGLLDREPSEPIDDKENGPFLCHVSANMGRGGSPEVWWVQEDAPMKDEIWLEPVDDYPVGEAFRFNKQASTFEMYDFETGNWEPVERK